MLLDRALFVAGCSLLLVAVLMVNKAELVPLSEFYPYGNSAGDTALNCTLEERRNGGCNSSLISIGYRGFRYAGARFTGLYVRILKLGAFKHKGGGVLLISEFLLKS